MVHHANEAEKVSACLNDTIWLNKCLRKEPKIRIYEAAVRPILTYSAGTRPDAVKIRIVLEITETLEEDSRCVCEEETIRVARKY